MQDWDLHKENVQPLSQGRRIGDLGRFLTTNPNQEDIKKREETRKEFEDQLRLDNEDLLAVWYDYINWVEQNYPEGGEEANLKKLIENCISDLFSNSKYHQDERFFRIFLRYTRIVNDALELFNIMYQSNIFTSIAAFYVNWANVVEKNTSKAEEIIQIGLDKLAQPTVQLELALKAIKQIAADNREASGDEEDVRKPFVPLKVEKKKSGRTLAPVERLGNYEQNNFKLLNQQQTTNKIGNKQVQIFSDENASEFNAAGQHEIINKLPTSNNQENVGKAGRWCDNKIKSKPRADQPVQAKFEIYDQQEETEANENGKSDELKITRQTNQQAKLKEIKKDENEPRLFVFEKLAPNQKFYCDLKRMYYGGTEYSFEEIRSIRLKLGKKKEEERLTKERLKKEVEDLKKQISERDNIFNDVESMKKKINDLLQRKKSSEVITNTNVQNSPDPRTMKKEDLTIIRDLWNGPIDETVDVEKELIKRPRTGDFSIFKDDELNNQQRFRQQNQFQDVNTIVLPNNDSDFVANSKQASTPSNFQMNSNPSLDENCTINVYQNDNKFLSPIVETSKEYKSSSSSLSSYSSYHHKSKTFHK